MKEQSVKLDNEDIKLEDAGREEGKQIGNYTRPISHQVYNFKEIEVAMNKFPGLVKSVKKEYGPGISL
uniref:Uncharacterized protein n=1 Tax=Beta vulgaris TaxID=161934 RepID=K4PYT9_BETVU|nr:hypothetical protein [Beta vulgaris]